MENNIENLFGELRNASAEAPKEAWNAIEDALLEEDIVSTLESTSVDTSYLWSNLATKLRWFNFLQFSFVRFNVYYLGLLLGGVLGIGVWGLPNKSTVAKNNTTIIAKNNTRNIIQKSDLPINKKDVTEKSNKQQSPERLNNTSHYQSKSKKKSGQATGTVVSKTKRKETKKQHLFNNKKITYSATIYRADDKNPKTLIAQNTPLVIDTMIVYDTVKVFDTIPVEKTKQQNLKLNQTPSETPRWIASLFVAPARYNTLSVSDVDDEHSNWAKMMDKVEKPDMLVSFGMGIKRNLNNHLFVGSGLQYANYRSSFQCEEIRTTIDTATQIAVKVYQTQHVLDKLEITVDTVSREPFVFNVYENGQLVKSDTSWYYTIDTVTRQTQDTITVWEKDTIMTQSVDTTREIRQYLERNSYSYMRIPLIGGYRFSLGKTDLSISGGLITDIFINAKGKGVFLTNSDYKVDDINKYPFAKLNFSLSANLGISYHLDKHVAFMSELFMLQNINNIYNSKFAVNRKNTTFGLKIGINYLFY